MNHSRIILGYVFILLNITANTLFAQGPNKLKCANVLPNGNVELTWELPSSTTGFIFHALYRDGVNIATISNASTTSYTDVTANANLQSYTYDFISSYLPLNLYNSNVIHTMLLTATAITNTNPGAVNLDWVELPLQSTSGNYSVYSDYNSVAGLQFLGVYFIGPASQTINDCNVPIQYQVRVPDISIGCVSNSNILIGTFSKLGNIVSNPDLRCASVLNNGNVQLSWLSPAGSISEFNDYKIYRDNVMIDSVGSFIQTTYTDLNVDANIGVHSYYVETNSGCSGLELSTSPKNVLSTMKITTATPTATSCQLIWNPMPLLPTSGFYEVNREINGSSILLFNTLATNYIDPAIPAPSTAYYYITVDDLSGCVSKSAMSSGIVVTGIESLSNKDCKVETNYQYSSNQITFSSPCIKKEQIQCAIYNEIGQLILEDNLLRNQEGIYSIEKPAYSKGVFIIQLKEQEAIYSGKIYLK